MKKNQNNPDKLIIKQKKGTWKRFIKLFPKCRLPWVWLIIYVVLSLGIVNVGVSETDYTAQLFAGDTSAVLLVKLIGAIVLNLIGSNFVIFASQITTAKTDRNMRSILFQKVLHLPMTYFKEENPREEIYRIVANSTVISSTLLLVIIPLFTAGYTAITVCGKVFTYDWRLSVILLAFIPVQILIAFLFGRLNLVLSTYDSAVNSELMQRLAELVTNIPLAKAFANEKKEAEKGAELTSRLYKINITASWISQFKNLSETVVSLVQSLVIVFVGVILLRNQEITTRAWIAFFMFSSVFTGAVNDLMLYWNNVKEIQGSADKVAEIMNAPEEDRTGDACESLRGEIRLEHIRFGYEENKPVLTDVSCAFQDNCVTALLGISGCGKTTIVNLLTRLYVPQDGSITINGKSVSDYALDDYRDQFVVVSQNSMLFSGTVRENVCYGNDEVSDDILQETLRKVGAYDFVMAMPNGVNTLIEEYGNNLSGGQRQRLAIARALLSDAHYIILDEPTASLDAMVVSELMDILKSISENRCMIVIAHTRAILPLIDRVIVLKEGIVSEEGDISAMQQVSPFLCELMGKKVAE